MKTRSFLIGAFALGLLLVATGANAYVGLGGALPSAADFNWVNNDIGTLTWTTGDGTIDIAVKVSAPDGDATNFPSAIYGSYYPGTLYGSFTAQYDTVTTETSGTFTDGTGDPTAGTTFDNMYGYFYTISLDSGYSGNLLYFGFNMGPATISEIGYDRSKESLDDWEISGGNTLLFNFPASGPGRFRANETATVYVASEYWWGWSNAIFEDGGNPAEQSSGGYNNTGQLPAPNPEAPTVALFILGIFGVYGGIRLMSKN